jgi:ribosomal protein S18 acetylase RimI-like enzyme
MKFFAGKSSDIQMINSSIRIRKANISDCSHIVSLYSIASDGIANYVWSTMAAPGENPEEVGLRRYQREDILYSYLNCIIAEADNQVIGMMLSYPMHIGSDLDFDACDPVLLPYARLEEDNSYYISAMAMYPDFRGMGIGKEFLNIAEEKAIQQGYSKLSLIVIEDNKLALSLYKKKGYKEVMRESIVSHPLIHCQGDALLMVKDLLVS